MASVAGGGEAVRRRGVCDQATVEKYTQLWTNLLK